jgi:hypothetical protein
MLWTLTPSIALWKGRADILFSGDWTFLATNPAAVLEIDVVFGNVVVEEVDMGRSEGIILMTTGIGPSNGDDDDDEDEGFDLKEGRFMLPKKAMLAVCRCPSFC